MREHPIPQDITNYRFHIIGSMTLRQFLEIAAGFVVAAILYKTNLLAIIKWPLIGISIAVGAAAAFVPIEERPLDHWIVTFIKVLYKPTQFFWKRTPQIPKVFSYVSTNQSPVEPEFDLSPIRRERIKEYIGSVSHSIDEPYSLTSDEQARVANILNTFTTERVVVTSASTHAIIAEKPDLEVRVRKLRPQTTDLVQPETVVYANPIEPTAPDPQVIPEVITAISTPLPSQTIDVPVPTLGVSYNTDLPFPNTPTEQNKIVGMVLTPSNDLISDAIVEIRTDEGVVARAVKTNALGQFFITTPLGAGTYTIVVEKENMSFLPVSIIVANQIINPIEIRSES